VTESALYRSVARRTGESVGFDRHMGFVLIILPVPRRTDNAQHASGGAPDDDRELAEDGMPCRPA
jgi:hypothetical protein